MIGIRAMTMLGIVGALFTFTARGQVPIVVGNNQQVGGVYIDTDGTVKMRQTETTNELATQRLRAKALAQPLKGQPITYISIPRVLAEARTLTEAGKEIPDDLKYLSGLTQIRFVFVFPEDHDIVIAGPSEPFDSSSKMSPVGKLTGRPVLHLDDLVTALRMASIADHRGRSEPFGCSIDPAPDAFTKSSAVMRDHAGETRAARMAAMKSAIGPQRVSMFGAPVDTRLPFVTLAADYKLKRICLGMDSIPVPGVGSPIDNSRAAGNRFWFEANYAPLLVSADQDAYEIRGQRLMLKVGALSFDEKGATETAKQFAKNFTAKFPQIATTVPLFADLQNVSDLALVAHLIRHDKLAQRAGVDLGWCLSEKNYRVATLATPKSAETIVNFASGSIVAGGVTLDLADLVGGAKRETDSKGDLKGGKVRPEGWSQTKGAEKPKG